MVREANYKLAKSHYLLGEEDEALKFFKILATDAKTTEGAEAKYFIAQIFYNKEKFDDAENEIMEFISANTPHQYWLAKSFILLSDVYMAKEDIFQAKHTLKSIVNNYTNTDDGIIAEAEEKIKNIETIEKETVITSENNEE
jgi:TolA-binding protein